MQQNRSGILFVELPEYAFLAFKDTTFRAAPRVRQILERNTRWDSPFLIPFCGIVDIVAFKTYPAGEFYHLLCNLVALSFLFLSIWSYMKFLWPNLFHGGEPVGAVQWGIDILEFYCCKTVHSLRHRAYLHPFRRVLRKDPIKLISREHILGQPENFIIQPEDHLHPVVESSKKKI